MGPKPRSKPRPSIFMAQRKKAVPVRTTADVVPVHDNDGAAAETENETRKKKGNAALSDSEAFLKDSLERAQPRTKLAPALGNTPAFDDRRDSAPADFDVPPLLRVGEFDEWWRKAEMMLISEGHYTLSLKEADSSADTAFYTNGREPARLLKRYVGKEVLRRVPTDALDHIHSLVPALRKITRKQFRFLDLPAKLRVRILEVVVQKKFPILVHAEPPKDGGTGAYKGSCYQPAICRISRQLRKESMPIFLKNNEFRVVRNLEKPAGPAALHDWSLANKRWISSLRRMTLQLRAVAKNGEVSSLQLHLSYDPGQGLQIDEDKAGLHEGHLAELRDRIERINTFGKAHDLEGQMLALFWDEPRDFDNFLQAMSRSEDQVDMEL